MGKLTSEMNGFLGSSSALSFLEEDEDSGEGELEEVPGEEEGEEAEDEGSEDGEADENG